METIPKPLINYFNGYIPSQFTKKREIKFILYVIFPFYIM